MSILINSNSIIIKNLYKKFKFLIDKIDDLYTPLLSLSEINELIIEEPIINIHNFINNLINVKTINKLVIKNISEYQLFLLLQNFENTVINKLIINNVSDIKSVNYFLTKNNLVELIDYHLIILKIQKNYFFH